MKIINIFIILSILAFSISCKVNVSESESRYNESDLPTANESRLLSSFESDQPDSSSLEVFEESALEKAEEFFDYLIIISDTSLTEKMRETATEECIDLFYKNDGKVVVDGKNMGVTSFIEKLKNHEIVIEWPSDFKTSHRFKASNHTDSYESQVVFNYADKQENGKTITLLIKGEKMFGEERRMIWEVFLQEVIL